MGTVNPPSNMSKSAIQHQLDWHHSWVFVLAVAMLGMGYWHVVAWIGMLWHGLACCGMDRHVVACICDIDLIKKNIMTPCNTSRQHDIMAIMYHEI